MYQHSVQQPQQHAGPDISLLAPILQEQWNHAANARLGSIVVRPQTNRKVSWQCDRCPDGHPHQWLASVASRTTGSKCPQCAGQKVCKHSSLATKAPVIAAQWDYKANPELGTPHTVMSLSHRAAGWLCHDCGHSWTARINDRVHRQTGCPRCGPRVKQSSHTKRPSFAESQHPLLAQWDHKRNAAQGNFPSNTTEGSNKQIYWLCPNCPAGSEHSWSTTPARRTGKHSTGCPFCTNKRACKCNSLEALYPARAAEWDYHKNVGGPADYLASSGYQAWWQTPERGSWQQVIKERTSDVDRWHARQQLTQDRMQS